MELHHLRYFVAVAEDLSVTKAAKRLGMAQPPLSRQIRSLENELAVQLFERRSGKLFLTHARRPLPKRRSPSPRTSRSRHRNRPPIQKRRTGHSPRRLRQRPRRRSKPGNQSTHAPLPRHRIRFPRHPLRPPKRSPPRQKNRLGFSHGPATSLEVASEKLFRESLSVVLPRTNPLSKRRHLRLKDLRHETLLLIERSISPNFHDLALTLCRNACLSPRIVLTESTIYDEAGAMMTASNKGIFLAVGKNPTHPSFADRLTVLPLREPQAIIEVHTTWRRDETSPTILNFIQTAKSLLQNVHRVQDMRNFPRIAKPTPTAPAKKRKTR